MNKLISKVTPLTKAIIWLASKPLDPQSKNYQAIDYLLNGLLTSSRNVNSELISRTLIGEQFGGQLHIFVAHEPTLEFKHFIHLIEDKLTTENNILVIDELNAFEEINKYLSSYLRNNIVKYQ
ncbi:MAG TPA: hypothetical protein VKZ84_03525 [Bacteriovoracaceae bacterium]|nr:hypothetical protein [Bacteriovoracaceae bacterium]